MGLFGGDSSSESISKQSSIAAQTQEGDSVSARGSVFAETTVGNPVSFKLGMNSSNHKVDIQQVDFGAVMGALELADRGQDRAYHGQELAYNNAENNLAEVLDFAEFAMVSSENMVQNTLDGVTKAFDDVASVASSTIKAAETPESMNLTKMVIYGAGFLVVAVMFMGKIKL